MRLLAVVAALVEEALETETSLVVLAAWVLVQYKLVVRWLLSGHQSGMMLMDVWNILYVLDKLWGSRHSFKSKFWDDFFEN